MLCDTNIFPGLNDNVKRKFYYILSEEMEVVCDNLRDYSGVISTLNTKLKRWGGGGGLDLFDPPPGSARISVFRLCTEVQSNGDHARCQRIQLMQQA